MHSLTLSLLHLPDNFAVKPATIKQLAEPQQQRLQSLGGIKRRAQFIAGRLLLVKGLAAATTSNPHKWRIEENPGAAPTISTATSNCKQQAPKFSLSHSGNVVGLAMLSSDAQNSALLGLDIEQLDPARRLQTAPYFCNTEQLQQLNMEADELAKKRYMTRLWTQKEAFFKAHGQSIFNSNLQTLGFVKATKETANLVSCSQQNQLACCYLSIYCNTPHLLQLEHFRLDTTGKVVQLAYPESEWLPFRVTNEDN